jgi:hypothetical protein
MTDPGIGGSSVDGMTRNGNGPEPTPTAGTVQVPRRQLLTMAAAGTVGLLSAPTWSAAQPRYDFSNPADNLQAFVKITGDLTGRETYQWSSGRLFGSTPGNLAKPLADFQACRKQQYLKVADGYRCLYRGMIIFFELQSENVLRVFDNPYTDKRNDVTHYRTQLSEYTITPQGYRGGITEIGESGVPRKAPFLLDWTVAGDDVWVSHDERLKYTRPGGGNVRIDNLLSQYHCRFDELNDTGLSSVRCDLSWRAELTWFPWMGMDGHPGHIFWGGMGRNYHEIDDLPDRLLTAVDALWPGALSQPLI